jgi:hypothetical protein
MSDALGALYAGAFALADLGEVVIAARLRAAVLDHASRIGTDPRRYAPRDVDAQLDRALAAVTGGGDATISWSELLALFTCTVDTLAGEAAS